MVTCLSVATGVRAADDEVLTISGEAVHILELRCNADKSVAATAIVGKYGVLLHSVDAGLTWSVALQGGDLKGVAPRFFDDPRDGNDLTRPLVVSGYKTTHFIQFGYELGAWATSNDSGRTWAATSARLPSTGSGDPVGLLPPLVVVGTGRLATIRQLPSPALLTSDDQGAAWSESRLPLIDTSIYGLLGDGRDRLVAVGSVRRGFNSLQHLFSQDRLVVVQSDDGGKTWSVAMDVAADHLNCYPRMIGTADGAMLIYNPCPDYGKRYYVSSDGGRTWNARQFQRYFRGAIELLTALDDNRWVGLSREGRSLTAWISDNGGVDWHGLPTGFATLSGDVKLHMQSIVALGDGSVLAYVGDGQVLRSADRGESWELVDTGMPRKRSFLMEASCTDGRGLVVLGGSRGMLVRSSDAGRTWERGRLAAAKP